MVECRDAEYQHNVGYQLLQDKSISISPQKPISQLQVVLDKTFCIFSYQHFH